MAAIQSGSDDEAAEAQGEQEEQNQQEVHNEHGPVLFLDRDLRQFMLAPREHLGALVVLSVSLLSHFTLKAHSRETWSAICHSISNASIVCDIQPPGTSGITTVHRATLYIEFYTIEHRYSTATLVAVASAATIAASVSLHMTNGWKRFWWQLRVPACRWHRRVGDWLRRILRNRQIDSDQLLNYLEENGTLAGCAVLSTLLYHHWEVHVGNGNDRMIILMHAAIVRFLSHFILVINHRKVLNVAFGYLSRAAGALAISALLISGMISG